MESKPSVVLTLRRIGPSAIKRRTGVRVAGGKVVTVTFHRFLPTAKVTVTTFPLSGEGEPSPAQRKSLSSFSAG